MNFFWTSGHFGWAFFSLIAFTGLWCLMIDIVWRVTHVTVRRLAFLSLVGWAVAASAILWGFPTGR